jgi:hypothetical protein
MHVVFGTGPVGRSTAEALRRRGAGARLVRRTPVAALLETLGWFRRTPPATGCTTPDPGVHP